MINCLETEKRPIAVFDSGVGGLPYLELAVRKLPEECFYYIADTENFPYGEKDTPAIRKIVSTLIGRIIEKWQPKCIIIACNTATVIALSLLREQYNVPFIGVVPAVKPAAAGSKKKKFGVLATLRTSRDDYLAGLVKNFAQSCDVTILPAGQLADIVEEHYFSLSRENKINEIQKVISKISLDEIDSIVLGCTHFIHLEEEFKTVLGNKIQLIDSRTGVINQLIRILDREQMRTGQKTCTNTLYVSRETVLHKAQYLLFAEKYHLRYGGEL